MPFDEDFIVALTAMNHGGRGSASLIGALQVLRMHLQRDDMNCMKSKAYKRNIRHALLRGKFPGPFYSMTRKLGG